MKALLILTVALVLLQGCKKDNNTDHTATGNLFVFSDLTPPDTAAIGADDTIRFTLPPGTDPTHLRPTVVFSGSTQVSPASLEPQDFSQVVTYTVTTGAGTHKYYARANRPAASAKDIPTPPKALCLYFAWPSYVNGSNGNVASAVNVFSHYNIIVFGNGLWDSAHPDHTNTIQIISSLRALNPSVKIFGYVNVDSTQSPGQLRTEIDAWKSMGVTGIYGDRMGREYTPLTQVNDFIDYVHSRSLDVFANAWHINDVLANDAYGNPSHLREDDYYLLESLLIGWGVHYPFGDFKTRADSAYLFMKTKHINIAAVSTILTNDINVNSNYTDDFKYAWCGAAMYNFDAFQFTDKNYSSNSQLYYYPGLSSSYGTSWLQYDWVKTVSATEYSRATNTKTISIKTDGTSYWQGSVTP